MGAVTATRTADSSTEAAGPRKAVTVYLLLVVLPVIGVVVSLRYGGHVGSPTGHQDRSAQTASPDVFGRLLVTLPVVLLVCRLLGEAIGRLAQPPVMGEIVAGVLLGPSLLGWLWPGAYGWLFPSFVTGTLNALAQLGLVLFMFLVGYELDLDVVRRRGYLAAVVSHVSIALPFLAGVLLALGMYHSFAPAGQGFIAFALFLAASMSITAFPVLARILTDRGMTETPLGSLALACAAVDDVSAWTLLAAVTAIVKASSLLKVGWTFLLALVFFVGMVTVVRPLIRRWLAPGQRHGPAGAVEGSDTVVLTALLVGILLSSGVTNAVGIHPIFGAFLLGAVLPRKTAAIERAVGQMQTFAVTMLVPLFFVYTGLHTKLALLGGSVRLWGWCALVTVAAMVSKWTGSTIASRATGLDWSESMSVGALMNCRGLTELVVLNVGLSLGVINLTVFAMLLVMTLVSTFLTAPSLTLIERRAARRAARAAPYPLRS
jgi:Kef-type K+ transport system membrane component KefB